MMFGHSHSTTLSTPDTNSCSFRIRGASSSDHRAVSEQNVYVTLRDRSQHTFYSTPRHIVLSFLSCMCPALPRASTRLFIPRFVEKDH